MTEKTGKQKKKKRITLKTLKGNLSVSPHYFHSTKTTRLRMVENGPVETVSCNL